MSYTQFFRENWRSREATFYIKKKLERNNKILFLSNYYRENKLLFLIKILLFIVQLIQKKLI